MPMIFAHRGVRKDFPENTMPAFRAALTMGLEGIELDVQRTADGRLVICHDENLKRLTGNDLLLKDLTWEQLSALNAGFYFPGAPVERIPSLEEFFNWFAQTPLTVNIEIKNSVFPFSLIESEILDAIDHYHLRKRVIISSFNLQSVVEMKHLAPDIDCAYLFKRWPHRALRWALAYGLDSLHPHYLNLLAPGFVAQCREQGVKIRAWTVNHPVFMRTAGKKNIDVIMTDDPARALLIRDQK